MRYFRLRLDRFRRRDDGAALVEFALCFPLVLLFFAIVVEMSRMLWSYQIAVSGVRDASRYLGRVVPIEICKGTAAAPPTNVALPSYVAAVTKIVSKDMLDAAVLPSSVTVNSVSPVYSCRVGTYRTNPAPVARVTASLTLSIPLAALFQNFVTIPTTITTTVSGETRVFGT